ncbi:hypothetical protein ACFL50_04290 [Candidatus Latescibacterota bacterium]
MRIIQNRPNLLRWITVGFIFFMVIISPEKSISIGFDYGADLRQNALIMKWPSQLGNLLTSDAFGISETKTRIHSRLYSGSITINGAFETSAGFNSTNTGLAGAFGSEGGIFGKGKPLENWDLTADHIKDKSTTLKTRIERLDIRFNTGSVDINIGRQPVSLGTSHFVGVLDVIAPFAPGDMDATYKPGVDAIRVRKGIGMTGEAEVIAVASNTINEGAILGRYRKSMSGVDFEFVGGRFRRRGFGGFGWEGEIGKVGIWGEMAMFERRQNVEKWRGGWSKAAFSCVAGIDLNLPYKFKFGESLMFQDFGVRDPKDLADIYNDAPFREGWAFLGSAAYTVLTLHRELHPLVQSDLAGIVNLIDNSTLWQPRITISTGDETDLSFYGWIGSGKKSRINGASVLTRSEFGMLPDGAGFYARWFF